MNTLSDPFVIVIVIVGAVRTFVGGGLDGHTIGCADGFGTMALFAFPLSITMDTVGNFFVTDSGNNQIRKLYATGMESTKGPALLSPFF